MGGCTSKSKSPLEGDSSTKQPGKATTLKPLPHNIERDISPVSPDSSLSYRNERKGTGSTIIPPQSGFTTGRKQSTKDNALPPLDFNKTTKPRQRSASVQSYAEEVKIELIFKGKRSNVFNAGITEGEMGSYKELHIPKTSHETILILQAIDQNFVFTSLDSRAKQRLCDAMTKVNVKEGDHIITQGDVGDYFYIIHSGKFSILVDGDPVSELESGRSFGELALMFGAPRAATVQAMTDSVLYALDRNTFRMVLANSQTIRNNEIKDALMKVPLLAVLTETQIAKVADIVALLPFPAGDVIIKKGTEGNVFYMIKEGSLRVTEIGDGRTYPDLTLGPGEYFGERALITGDPRAANVTATTNVILMAIDRESFNSVLGPLKEMLNENMILRVLNSIKWFDTMNVKGKLKVAHAFVLEQYPGQQTVVKEGLRASKFFILNAGQCKIISATHSVKDIGPHNQHGNGIKELTSGMYFGELSLIDDEPNRSTIVTTAESEFFTLSRDRFNEVMISLSASSSSNGGTGGVDLSSSSKFNFNTTDEVVSPLQFNFEDLEHIGVLGSGTFGRVTLVRERTTKNIYALKTMLKTEIVAHKQQVNVLNERNIMISCNHPFILRLYQTFRDVRKLYMLLEFVQGGELFSVIHTVKTDGIPDAQAKFYSAGIILALGYLHKKNVAYRDLKPENCLIDSAGYPKLIDFGFAKTLVGSAKTYTLCGTPEYLAPELVLGRGHNRAVDYWAFGILVYEMQAGFSPFSDAQGMDQVIICRNIVNGRLSFPRSFNIECKDLCKKLLVREIQNRLGNQRGGVDDVIRHPWFAKLDLNLYLQKSLKAPWIPKVKSITDASHFDPSGIEDHPNDGPIDTSQFDRNF